ncbi:MAG TPA: ATP-binding cassette domain-containing protein, partial [Myxococcota bacterium]|nr:ATP-binding cassette domain-containing protein [Myxococcota bacterium]
MATLDFVGIEKSYGAVRVLHRVDLSVADGEFLVLVGPSGCGKSTLLRSIAGLEEITSGELRIDGKRVNDTAPADRDVAMVFQSYALYPHMTVRENMAFALRLKKHPETDARVAEAARMLGLEPLLDRLPKELSGGQRQRVAMGRAIVRRPKVFLFDEPLSNLDAALRQQLRVEIKRLQSSLRTTTVYVTHDQIEAMTLADRIVVLQGGVLQQVGSPDELYNNPANRFVAGFIGSPSMNFLEKVEAGVVVGVRPNDVVLGAGPLRGQVEVVERMGFESMVHLRVGGEALVVRVEGEPPKGEVQLRLE